jgi:hypothetical protein
MAKITFIILAHENAGLVADFARLLTEWNPDSHAVIHYDLKSPEAQFRKLKNDFAGSDRVHLVRDRIRCGWGDFTLVKSVLNALRLIRDENIICDRVMLVSGACMPIRPLAELSDFLDAHPDREFIETFDSDWIVGGLREERWQYHHVVNHRTYYNTFRFLLNIQRAVGLRRKMPRGLVPKFGSQWWVLTWRLCDDILRFIDDNPDVYKYFRTTWIPDELFFQTLAYHLVASENLAGHNLTFYQFNDWGMPIVFSDSHMPLLETIPRFFARKIGGGATGLKKRLYEIARTPRDTAVKLPDLPPKWRFPAREIAIRNSRLTPGYSRLFAHDGMQTLLESLFEYDRSFVVLYGPPAVTARIMDTIRNLSGYTVLGRIFHPETVDFGSGVHEFHGLRSSDRLIRNAYPVNYFRRVLTRCEKLPVIAMSPGDNPEFELQFFQSRQAAVFTLFPKAGGHIWQDLYWLLCCRGLPARPTDDMQFTNAFLTRADSMVATRPEIRSMLNEQIIDRAAPIAQTELENNLAYAHGEETAQTIMHLYHILASSALGVDFNATVSALPKGWRDRFGLLDTGHPVWSILPDTRVQAIDIAASELLDA